MDLYDGCILVSVFTFYEYDHCYNCAVEVDRSTVLVIDK